MTVTEGVGLFSIATIAGAVNAIAGGGSLLTFPALLWLGRDPIVANATNTVTLWPGSLAAALALRRELRGAGPWLRLFAPACVAGAIAGAALLLRTPSHVFATMVPYLILFATGLFAIQGPLARRFGAVTVGSELPPDVAAEAGVAPPTHHRHVPAPPPRGWPALFAVLFQLAVAVYGGYFGAGIGILTLGALGIIGFADIHQMIGIRNVNAVWINGVAGAWFVAAGVVRWPDAIVLTAGQIVGGYTGARLTRRLTPVLVRRAVVLIGAASAAALLVDVN